jgi:thioredoxin 1
VASKLHTVTPRHFKKQVLRATDLVLVDFFATWCQPCKLLEPILEELAFEFADKVRIVRFDTERTEAAKKIAASYRVRGVPCMILFLNGDPFARLIGAYPKSVIRDFIKRAVAV